MRRTCAHAGVLVVACGLTWIAEAQQPSSQPSTAPTASAPAATSSETAEASPEAAPPGQPRSLLDFRQASLELGIESSYDRREVRFQRKDPFRLSYSQVDRAARLSETVGGRASGSIVDERAAQFDASARWGLSQEWYSQSRPGPDQHEDPHGNLLEYDVNLNLLPRGKVSANAFAQRQESRLPRAFLPSLDRSLERYGADVVLQDAYLPMRFSFEHTWDELNSRTNSLRDDEQRGDNRFRYEATWQISPNQSLRLDYEYDDRREQYSGTRTRFDTTRNYLTLNHVLRFGEDAKSSWETLVRVQDESGDLARDATELSSRLRLQHTRELASQFALQYLRDSYAELATDTLRGEAGLTHQLDDWLTSTAQLYALKQGRDENADSKEWGGLANVAFNRPNPLGRLSANVSYQHARVDTDEGTHRGVVIAESITFRDPLPAYLAHTDVDGISVVVTDVGRARTYLPGRDYTLLRMGRYTALRRVPNGAIQDRQTVLVTYLHRVSSDYAVSRDRADLRIQQEFKFGLTPYYAGSLQTEDLDAKQSPTWRERDVNRHRLGATYRQPRWSVTAEYEYNDDSIDPYQAMHGTGDAVLWQAARHELTGKAAVSRYWFTGAEDLPPRDTTLLDLGAAYRCLLARDFEASASAMYRFEDDTLYGRTNGVDLEAGLDWRIGYFTLRFEAEYDMLDLPDSRDRGLSFWVKLKREIPVLAKDAR